MIYHLAGHPPVDTDILTCNKPSLIRCQEQYHIGNIQGIAYTASRLLCRIRSRILFKVRIDPARRNGIHPDASPAEAHCQCMSEGSNAALGGRITFGLGLAHAISG